jgi:hypothetical protein
MARRGLPPRGEYINKSNVLSTRIREDTRHALEQAAQANKRSLSQEIEFRLRRSLADDVVVTDRFGSRTNYALLRTIACIMDLYPTVDGSTSWLDDPFTFERTKRTIVHVLEAFRPPGELKPPQGFEWIGPEDLAFAQSGRDAAVLLTAIKDAEPPSPALKVDDHPLSKAPYIKADLASRMERIGKGEHRIVAGTADDFRRAAEEMRREEAAQQPVDRKPRRARK